MDNFIVSARKYRPVTFESVVGQQHITNTLKNAIKNNQLAQAFLFCGPRGVGKTTCARILAKTINCENLSAQLEPCGQCESCRSFQNGNSFSIHELDAASNNSVDDIRSLIEQVRIPPQSGRYKIYIIDEVHMLSQAAFNAFLKTLEEPPPYAIFILATTEKHKILPTILSRCQIFDFNRIQVEDIAHHLASIAKKEDIRFDNDGLHLIGQKADGGLRDALSMFDQIVSFSNRNVTYKAVIDNLNILDYDYYFRITDCILKEDVPGTLLIFNEILVNGFDGNHFISGLASHFRNLLVGKDHATLKLLEVSDGIRSKYMEQSDKTNVSFLLSALNIANQCDLNYKVSKNQRLQVELALIKICHIRSALNLSAQKPDTDLKKKPQPITELPAEKQAPEGQHLPQASTPGTDTQITPSAKPAEKPGTSFEKVIEETRPTDVNSEEQIRIRPVAAASSLIPNLNTLSVPRDTVKESGPSLIAGDSQEEFSEQAFYEAWTRYALKAKEKGKINLFTLMTAHTPVLEENNSIKIEIDSSYQKDLLKSEKIDLLNALRTDLRNFNIDIRTVAARKDQKKKPYTNREKFLHMAEKNPRLEDLRQRFDLDIS